MEPIKKIVLLFLLLGVSTGYSQTTYCASPRPSTNQGGAYSVNFTCRNVSGTTYEYKLEFAVPVGIANANIGANPGPVNIGANLVSSNGGATWSYTFNAASTPSLYVNYLAVTMAGVPGVVEWNQLPTNANWNATCAAA